VFVTDVTGSRSDVTFTRGWPRGRDSPIQRWPSAAGEPFATDEDGRKFMVQTLKRLWQDEEAPTAVEYAVMVAVIALIVIAGAALLGTAVNKTFADASTKVPGTAATPP
jgi:pilus assembly protein Flp/PilA